MGGNLGGVGRTGGEGAGPGPGWDWDLVRGGLWFGLAVVRIDFPMTLGV